MDTKSLSPIMKGIAGALKPLLEEVYKRLAALESSDSKQLIGYAGVWKEGAYQKGALVTCRGGLWVAHEPTSDRPGTPGGAWQLIVKSGR